MARSSSPGRRDRDRGHKQKDKRKERDRDKERDKESRREAERRDRDKERERQREREKEYEREKEREKERERERDKERDRDRDRERHRERDRERDRDRDRYKERHDDRDKDRSRRERTRSKSRSKSPDERDRKRRRKDDEPPAMSKEEMEKKRKADEQAALEAEMERRRQKVEEWRRKKQEEELKLQQEQAALLVEQQQEEQKRWTLEDDALSDDDGQQQEQQQQANGSSTPADDAAADAQPMQQDDDDVDPLDAFMAGNEQVFRKDLRAAAALQQQQQQEEELDPLDAFMAGTVLPQASSALAAAVKQEPGAGVAIKEEEQQQAAAAAGPVKKEVDEKPAAAVAAAAPRRRPVRRYMSDSSDDSSDEEEVESDDEEWAKAVTAGKLTKGDKLGVVDHSTINYQPFRKNFYIEVPELARMSASEVDELRKELDGIKVRGLNAPKPVRAWTQCGLSSRVMDVLKRAGFDRPLPIQAQALPIIMSGRDCIGIAKTGSGKTLAFVIPMLRHIKDQRPIQQGDGPVALIMAPTRELVNQISKEIKTFAKHLGMVSVAVFGGSGVANQIRELKRGAEVVVCTPGRMIDLLATGSGRITNLRRVTYLVLDEADRMFDMGFEPQIMRIVNNIRPDRQTVLFSATFPRQVEALARTILQDPVEIQVGGRSVVNSDIAQFVEIRPEEERFLRLLEVLGEWYERGKIIVFVHSQDKCDTLFRDLLKSSYPCLSLHGGKDQADREGTIADFKKDVCNILVATSVAARGLDVKDLVLVVNYDVPNHLEDYVHRVGRTGRAGNKGTAITFIGPDEERYAPDLVKALKESGAPVAGDLQAMADSFASKRKQGLAQAHGSGYGGSGFKFDASEEDKHKAARKAKAKEYGLAEEGSESDDDDIRPSTAATAAVAPLIVGADGQPVAAEAAAATGHQPAVPQSNEVLSAAAQRVALQMNGSAPIVANAANFAAQAAARAAALAAAWGQGGGGPAMPAAPQFESTLDINDFPQHARWKVTHKDAMAMITELTGAAVTTKGIYIPPNRPIPEGESRLHLLIEGPTELSVKRAKQEIKRILEETTEKVMRRDAPAAGGKYSVM